MPVFQNKRFTKHSMVALFAAIVVCLFSACVSAPHAFTNDPLAILGADASWYAVVPVFGNRVLLEELAQKMDDPGSVRSALNRTNRLYLAGNPLQDEPSGFFPFKLLATGSYPKSLASIAFSSSRGWEKQPTTPDGVWYKNGDFAGAIPSKGLVCMSDSHLMPGILENLHNPFLEPVAVDPVFRASIEQPITDSQITVYISEAKFFLQLLLSSDITFDVLNILITATPDSVSKEQSYLVGARITFADQRNARAFSTLLRLVLGIPMTIEGNTLILHEQKMSANELAHKLDFLYF